MVIDIENRSQSEKECKKISAISTTRRHAKRATEPLVPIGDNPKVRMYVRGGVRECVRASVQAHARTQCGTHHAAPANQIVRSG